MKADDWERNAVYQGGYESYSPPIRWLWRFIGSLSASDRALLLKFCTGTSRLPVGGFKALSPRFCVQAWPYDPALPLPRAATCFNMLKLPLYRSEKELEKNVLLAIRFGSEGFSFT